MLIVDAGPLVAYLNRNDRDHGPCAALLQSRTDELVVTPYVVMEACYLLGKYVGAQAKLTWSRRLRRVTSVRWMSRRAT
jgi:predicted nucleic acid-binding protein